MNWNGPWRKRGVIFQSWFKTNWKLALSATFVLIAVVDTFFAQISTIAATFLGLAALPWLLDLFEKITLPGGIELNLRKIEETLAISGANPNPDDIEPFQYLNTNDPNLAMASLRIEIEKRLRKIAVNRLSPSWQNRPIGIGQLLQQLEKEGAIAHNVSALIKDMLPTLNAAAHGIELPDESDTWVVNNGPKLLSLLDEKT